MQQVTKEPRPRVLAGIAVKVPTSCGNMYVQLLYHKGRLFEVFANIGKTGGCSSSTTEGTTRAITAGLRSGVPMEEYVEQLRGIRCLSPLPFPKEDAVTSCADALAKTLEKYGRMTTNDIVRVLRDGLVGPIEVINDEVESVEHKKMVEELSEARRLNESRPMD